MSLPWTTVPDKGETIRRKLLDAELETEKGVTGQEFADVVLDVVDVVDFEDVVLDVVVDLDVVVVLDVVELDAELELTVVDELDDVVLMLD